MKNERSSPPLHANQTPPVPTNSNKIDSALVVLRLLTQHQQVQLHTATAAVERTTGNPFGVFGL